VTGEFFYNNCVWLEIQDIKILNGIPYPFRKISVWAVFRVGGFTCYSIHIPVGCEVYVYVLELSKETFDDSC